MSIRHFDDDLLRSRRRRFRSGSGSRRLWRGFSHGRYAFHGDVGAISQVATQGETLTRTIVDAGAAVHAGLQVDAPGAVSPVHGDGIGRAVAFALAAENTFHHIVHDVAPVPHGLRGSDRRHGGDLFLHCGGAVLLHHFQNDFRLRQPRGRVVGIHVETFLRAGRHAGTALHAGEGINLPLAGLPVHLESARRTALLTHTAEDALAHVIHHAAAHAGGKLLRLQWILGSHRRLK